MLRFASLLCSLIISMSVATAQTTAPPDSRLNRIAAEKTLRIAYRSDARPFSFQNPSNEASGFVVDLCRLVVLSMQHQLGDVPLTIEWVPVSVQDRFSVVANGKADMECGSSTITLGRMKEVDFSNPVFVESTGLLVVKTSGVGSFEQMAGKKIAVISGTTNEAAVLSQVKARSLPISVLSVADRDAGVAALESGQADAFASDKLLLLGSQVKHPEALALLPEDLSLEVYGIVAAARRLGIAARRQYEARPDLSVRQDCGCVRRLVRPGRPAAGRAAEIAVCDQRDRRLIAGR